MYNLCLTGKRSPLTLRLGFSPITMFTSEKKLQERETVGGQSGKVIAITTDSRVSDKICNGRQAVLDALHCQY